MGDAKTLAAQRKSVASPVRPHALKAHDAMQFTGPAWLPDANDGNEARFYATCSATDAVGNCVAIAAGPYAVTTIDGNTAAIVAGIIIEKLSATVCTVQRFGLVRKTYAGLTPGALYILGPDSQPALYSQFAGAVSYLQPIGHAATTDTLYLQPSGFAAPSDGSGAPVVQSAANVIAGQQDPSPNQSLAKPGDYYINAATKTFFGPAT